MEVKYKLYSESQSEKLVKLIEVYRKDPKKARVLFLNSGKGVFYKDRLVLFERGNDFEIITFRRTFGISVTNKLYSSEIKRKSIIYKSGKFWFINRGVKGLVQLTYNCLGLFFGDWGFSEMRNNEAYKYLLNKFTWIRFIDENAILGGVAFNKFIRYKLYNLNDALRHIFGAPLPVIKLFLSYYVDDNNFHNSSFNEGLKLFKSLKKGVINIENLRMDMLKHPFLTDTIRLGNMLNKKVNCSWSLKRLVSEHDKWSIEVSDILAELSELRKLNISNVYLDFANYAKLAPLKTNKALIREGSIQHHCVGSYSNRVNSGKCCIYHVEGYTLELGFDKIWRDGKFTDNRILYIVQFRGYRNQNAPNELESKIQAHLDEFNKNMKDYGDILNNVHGDYEVQVDEYDAIEF